MIFDAGSTGNLEIGGDLNAGGNITTAGSAGTFTFNGAGSQTINDYSFQNLTINKSSGTATLNGPVGRGQRQPHHHQRRAR